MTSGIAAFLGQDALGTREVDVGGVAREDLVRRPRARQTHQSGSTPISSPSTGSGVAASVAYGSARAASLDVGSSGSDGNAGPTMDAAGSSRARRRRPDPEQEPDDQQQQEHDDDHPGADRQRAPAADLLGPGQRRDRRRWALPPHPESSPAANAANAALYAASGRAPSSPS